MKTGNVNYKTWRAVQCYAGKGITGVEIEALHSDCLIRILNLTLYPPQPEGQVALFREEAAGAWEERFKQISSPYGKHEMAFKPHPLQKHYLPQRLS